MSTTNNKTPKVYDQFIEEIKNKIKCGEIKKGDKLPSEREMAESLRVSRASIREALRALEVIGLIESRQGAGNYIKTNFDNSLFEIARKRSYTENRKTSLMLDYPHKYYGLEPEPGIFVQSRVEQIIYRHLMNFKEKYNSVNGFDFKIRCQGFCRAWEP